MESEPKLQLQTQQKLGTDFEVTGHVILPDQNPATTVVEISIGQASGKGNDVGAYNVYVIVYPVGDRKAMKADLLSIDDDGQVLSVINADSTFTQTPEGVLKLNPVPPAVVAAGQELLEKVEAAMGTWQEIERLHTEREIMHTRAS